MNSSLSRLATSSSSVRNQKFSPSVSYSPLGLEVTEKQNSSSTTSRQRRCMACRNKLYDLEVWRSFKQNSCSTPCRQRRCIVCCRKKLSANQVQRSLKQNSLLYMYLAARDSPSCGVAILQLSRNKLVFFVHCFFFLSVILQYVSSRSQKQNIRQRFVRGAWHVFWHIIIQSHFCQSHKTLSIFLSTLFFLPLIKNFIQVSETEHFSSEHRRQSICETFFCHFQRSKALCSLLVLVVHLFSIINV